MKVDLTKEQREREEMADEIICRLEEAEEDNVQYLKNLKMINMKKIYVVFNLSHKADDYDEYEVIEYITNDPYEALIKIQELEEFCDEHMDDKHWTYHYVLKGYDVPYNRLGPGEETIHYECKNYKDED